MCNNCNPDPCSCQETPVCAPGGCPINLSTECVFYNLDSDEASGLSCIGFENGASLKSILEEFDSKLCSISAINILSYNIPCLLTDYVITDFQEFIEAVDQEFCTQRVNIQNNFNTLNSNIASLSTTVTGLVYPNVSNCGTIGLLPTDTFQQVLQKYANAICNIQTNCCSDNSPNLSTTDSSSIQFATSGTKNHNLTGSVKLSTILNNKITIQPDGLYCNPTIPDYTQVLSYNSGTNVLSLSNGGGSVVLNSFTDSQTLSLNCTTKILTISGGNSVDLSCVASAALVETSLTANDSSTINFTTSGTSGHILTGDVIIPALISTSPGNSISYTGGGLYSSALDQKVKTHSLDPTAGFLEDKIAGKSNSLITTTATTNLGTHKSEIESVLDVSALISLIGSNPTFLTALCNIVKNCMCYSFKITNNGGSSATYDYVDCSGTSFTGLSLAAGASVSVCGKSAASASSDILIQNLGNC